MVYLNNQDRVKKEHSSAAEVFGSSSDIGIPGQLIGAGSNSLSGTTLGRRVLVCRQEVHLGDRAE